MPKRVRKIGKIIETPEVEIDPDLFKLQKNRIFRFKKILGDEWDKKEIFELANSRLDYYDLEKLIDEGCPPDLAIKILS